MPRVLDKSGAEFFIANENLEAALASGTYSLAPGEEIQVTTPAGRQVTATPEQLADMRSAGLESAPSSEEQIATADRSARIERQHGGLIGGAGAALTSAIDTGLLGIPGAIVRATSPDLYEELKEGQEAHPVVTPVAGAVGAVGSSLATGGFGAAKLGMGATAEGAGLIARAGRAALATGFEGGVIGAGAGFQKFVEADDHTVEGLIEAIGSDALLGAATGGALGVAGVAAKAGASKVAKGLARSREIMRKARAAGDAAESIPDDLRPLVASGDRAGLRAARNAEIEAIEQSVAGERQVLATDLASSHAEAKASKWWLATEDKSLRKVALQADKRVTKLTDNLKGLERRPYAALEPLEQKEQVLRKVIASEDSIRKKIAEEVAAGAVDAGQTRLAALDAAKVELDRVVALQSRITKASVPRAEWTSPRLAGIDAATDAIMSGGGKKGFLEQVTQGTLFGATMSALPSMPLGSVVAPLVSAKVAGAVTNLFFGRGAAAVAGQAERTAAAVARFVESGAKRVAPALPPLATKTLNSVTFAPPPPAKRGPASAPAPERGSELLRAYRKREGELFSQVAAGPDGKIVMTREARARVAARLAPLHSVSPLLADKLETAVAKKVEFLASKLPKRPDFVANQIGADIWQPSNLEMRRFARYVAAAEDPGAVEERLADGTVSPEDAEAYRELYPERLEALKHQILEHPGATQRMPYARRLSLSLLTGVPLVAALDPEILKILQAQYTSEPGTEGGMQAPVAQPQFGSIKSADKPTPAQERAG